MMFCSKIYRLFERNMCPFLCCLKSRAKVMGSGIPFYMRQRARKFV